MVEKYLPLLLFVPFLWLIVIWIHGLVKTESLSDSPWATFFRAVALGSLTAVFFVWMVVITLVPLVVHWNFVPLAPVNMVFNFFWPWIIWILIINILTGIINHLILRAFSIKKWGTPNPNYKDWNEFDTAAHTGGSHTTIWFNNSGLSPIHRTDSPSLSSRATSKVNRSSSTKSNVNRSSVFPVFLSAPTRSTSSRATSSVNRSSSKSSSSGSGGGGGAIGIILMAILKFLSRLLIFLFQLFIILAFIAVFVFYGWLAYWLTDRISDWFDEQYVLDVYSEEAA